MAVNNLDLLSDEDLTQHRKGREHCREGCRAIYHPVRQVINLNTIGEIANPCTSGVRVLWRSICMCDNYHAVATVHEFSGQLVDVGFYTSRLRVEEV